MPNLNLGAVLLVAGTAIGAGMLALPIATAKLGFITAMVMMIGVWIFMLYNAIILVELQLVLKYPMSIPMMSKKLIGNIGYVSAIFASSMLFFALLAAYISGLVSIIQSCFIAFTKFQIPEYQLIILISLISSFIIFRSTQAVDYTNRLFFLLKIICLIILLLVLQSQVEFEILLNQNFILKGWIAAIPILITSFGFHGSIFSVLKYIKSRKTNISHIREKKTAIKAMIIGSLIPLLVYCVWLGAALGTIPLENNYYSNYSSSNVTPNTIYSYAQIALSGNSVGALISSLSAISRNTWLQYIVMAFSWFAIVTSLLGVSIGFFDFFIENFQYSEFNKLDRLKAVILVFALPTIIVLLGSNIFVTALSFAAIMLIYLAVILPSIAALKVLSNPKILLDLVNTNNDDIVVQTMKSGPGILEKLFSYKNKKSFNLFAFDKLFKATCNGIVYNCDVSNKVRSDNVGSDNDHQTENENVKKHSQCCTKLFFAKKIILIINLILGCSIILIELYNLC